MSMQLLPNEILVKVCKYLKPVDFYEFCKTSKQFYGLISNNIVWHYFCIIDYGVKTRPDLAQRTYQNWLIKYGYKKHVRVAKMRENFTKDYRIYHPYRPRLNIA